MPMLRLPAVAALTLCLASVAVADYVPMPIKWDNGLPNLDPLARDWQSDLINQSIVGDDFLCNDPHPITQVQWWGSLMVGAAPPLQPDFWRFSWWQYLPPDPLDLNFSHPGQLLLWNDVANYQWQVWYDDPDPEKDIYHYYTRLPVACEFDQLPGQMYFLAIQAGWQTPLGQIWGWHESIWQWNDDAVQDLTANPWFDNDMLPIERELVSRDMAFQLGIPEPSTSALVLIGAALLWARRRRTT